MIYSSNGDIQINDFATQNIVIEFLFHLDTAWNENEKFSNNALMILLEDGQCIICNFLNSLVSIYLSILWLLTLTETLKISIVK